MIVMKFGGSSVGSAAAIKRVAGIVQSQLHLHPIVVVSAFANTTDQLTCILKHSAAGESYSAWKLIKELREYYFDVAESLLGSRELETIDKALREAFRSLHVSMSEVCDGERTITPQETDSTLSLGEQLSSLIVCAAFRQLGVASCHSDARALIQTDNCFTNATPRYWETYARIRWAIPAAASKSVVVMGGFIGATETGQTTTLGRGGSDLTATLVGAAINAEEVQIWKDVDGILTADPRRRTDALLVKSLSYQEAGELAKAGSQVLHPETIAPVQRLRIPVSLRNTFNPQAECSRIGFDGTPGVAKSIVCQAGVAVLEISSGAADVPLSQCLDALRTLLQGRSRPTEFLGMNEDAIYLALNGMTQDLDLPVENGACVKAHLRTEQALITLIGFSADDPSCNRVKALWEKFGALVLPRELEAVSLRIAVPEAQLIACLDALHRALFDAARADIFSKPAAAFVARREKIPSHTGKDRSTRLQQALKLASLSATSSS